MSERSSAQQQLALAKLIWRSALISLPLDLLVAATMPRFSPAFAPDPAALESLAFLLLSLSALVVVLGSLPDLRERASLFRANLEGHSRRLAGWAIALAAVVLLLQTWRSGLENLFDHLISIAVTLGTLLSVYQAMNSRKSAVDQPPLDPEAVAERQLFALSVIPIGCARLGSLGFTVSHCIAGPVVVSDLILVWILVVGLLLSLEPADQQFVAICPRCGSKSSRIRMIAGLCPTCHLRVGKTNRADKTQGDQATVPPAMAPGSVGARLKRLQERILRSVPDRSGTASSKRSKRRPPRE